MYNYKVGETLKELRIHQGLTQQEISQQLNISRQVYSYYESGRRLPDLDTACRLAAYFHITLDQLVLTGLHPPVSDPFLSLPEEYQDMLRSYHQLSPDNQQHLREYMDFLSRNSKF